MPKELSAAQIKDILEPNRSRSPWPPIEDKVRLLKAIKDKAKLIEMNGVVFKLRYSEGTPWKVTDGVHSTVFVSPVDGSCAPCGWFSEESLKKELE